MTGRLGSMIRATALPTSRCTKHPRGKVFLKREH
jgi:hypothetical protein